MALHSHSSHTFPVASLKPDSYHTYIHTRNLVQFHSCIYASTAKSENMRRHNDTFSTRKGIHIWTECKNKNKSTDRENRNYFLQDFVSFNLSRFAYYVSLCGITIHQPLQTQARPAGACEGSITAQHLTHLHTTVFLGSSIFLSTSR